MPGLLADLTNDRGILLIYISTDYVFDGTSPPYDVRDKANPLNLYGKQRILSADLLVLLWRGASVILTLTVEIHRSLIVNHTYICTIRSD